MAEMESTAKDAANRRQPCVCGSGKKFKNCCEGLSPEAVTARREALAKAAPAAGLPGAGPQRPGLPGKPGGPGFSKQMPASQQGMRAAAMHRRKV